MSNRTGRRILVLTSTFPRWEGDVEPAFVFDLCRQLVAGGLRVTVLAPHAQGACLHEVIDAIEVNRFRYGPVAWEKLAYEGGIMANLRRAPLLNLMVPFFLLAQCWAIFRILRAFRFEAVHAHWIIPQGAMLAIAQLFSTRKIRRVCTAHGSDISALRGPFWSYARRWVALRCDHVVTVSDFLRNALIAEGVPAEKISEIPMGTDLRVTFVPDGRARAKAEILFVGRLVEGKGLAFLIRALPKIRLVHPELILTIIGEGPERENVLDEILHCNVEASVRFVGAVEHSALPEYYRRATVFVLPSKEEGFGLVVIEALGCGCPVVVSDLPVLRNLLQDGLSGRLFQVGDSDDLAKKVCELLANEEARFDLGKTARTFVLDRFDWGSIGVRYLDVLLP